MKNLLKQIVLFILQKEAVICLKNNKPKVIAIYGKISRSIFKDEIVRKLVAQGRTARGSFKGYNSSIGIPLSILGLESGFSSVWKWLRLLRTGYKLATPNANYSQFLVLEIAADSESEIEMISRIIKPDCLVVSDFAPNGEGQNIQLLKKMIINMSEQGIILLNDGSDDLLKNNEIKEKKIITFGLKNDSDLKAVDLKESEIYQEFVMVYGSNREVVRLNKFGTQPIFAELVSGFLAEYFSNI